MTRLRELAHVRSGDKGDTAQLSVIAYRDADYPLLAERVTVKRVLHHLPGLVADVRARRFALPGLGALVFVLEGALAGGVTRSLALDAHGKTLAMQLLDLEIEPTGEEMP